jgi:hypothetical protein
MTAISGTEAYSSDLKLDYMKLLVTQLQNQDPLEPMDNAEMTSQLAQISQLEQLAGVNQSFEKVLQAAQLNQATGLIGRDVSFYDAVTDAVLSGPVSGVLLDGEAPRLQVGGHLLALSALQGIGESALSEAAFAVRQAAAETLGKTVSYQPDADKPALVGRVTEATVRDGQAQVTFSDASGAHTVPLDGITVIDASGGTGSEADLKRAGSLFQKTVYFDADGDGQYEQGVVSGVKMMSDGLYLVVGDHDVPLNSVLGA